MRKFTLILTGLLLACVGAFAQIKGTVVTEEDGEPVIGASIMVKGTTVGTISDVDGTFEVSASAGDVLVVSYIGMATQEVPAANGMVISLQSSATELEEVMAVAYGTTTKKAFTGAAQSKRGEDLAKMQVSDVSKSLDGAMSGVQVVSSSGQPGESASIRIRGVGSISASQSPLIVVDGIPYEGSLNSIPTQDIASLTVLKDAAANSMYGARGSNGVILITTKRGETGKVNVNLEVRVGGNMRGVPTYDIITDPGDYYEMMWEASRNAYLSSGSSYLASGIAASNDLIKNLGYNIYQGVSDTELINPFTGRLSSKAQQLKWTDNWLTEPFQTGLRQEYNLNISGGTDKTNYYISAGYLDDNGYIVNSGFQRFNVRAKVEQEVAKWLKVGVNASYAHTSQDSPTSGGSAYANLFMFSQMIAPIYPVYLYSKDGTPQYDTDGSRKYDFGEGEMLRPYASTANPLATNQANIYNSVWDNLNLRGFLDFTLYKGLKLAINASYDVYNINVISFQTPIGGDAKNVNGRGSRTSQRYEALNTNQLLTYENSFGEHGLNLLVGHEFKMDNSQVLTGSKSQFYDPTNPELENGGAIDGLTSYTSGYRVQGFMARAEYNFAERYYVSASYRCDGSSYFAPESRWGHFWSVGASWRMKEESWLRDVDAIHDLKIKASYGTQGNDNIGAGAAPYLDLYAYSVTDGASQPSVYLAQRGNRDLTWEKSNNLNVGIELGLVDRLDIEADFFIKDTKDMIYAKPLPPSVGSPSSIYTNEMDMRNIGVEVTLGATLVKTRDVKWTVDLNLTHYKNALTRLPEDKQSLIDKDGGYQAGSYWRSIGGSIYDFYDYHYLGVERTSGLPMYEVTEKDYQEAVAQAAEEGIAFDESKYGQMEDGTRYAYETGNASQVVLGKTAIPDLYGGLSTSLEFYGFDLNIQTAFQIGGYVYDSFYKSLMGGGEYGTNWHKDIFKRWTPTNTDTNVPRVEVNRQSLGLDGDAVLTSASYFSLRNITLGYSFPKKWMNKAKIKTLRLYVVADNIALATARKGLDPRQSFSGATDYNYSAMATVSGGITIGF
ncbi:MAG: TonB-dependent receptor [Bacteroidales bacterium]|nr:TonB-dependent receptor [Bacteroidales bacterium]